MAEGGGSKARRERAEAASDALNEQFKKAGLPSPRTIYQMGEEQFTHHVMVRSLEKCVKELGIDDDLWMAIVYETWVEEQTEMHTAIKEMRSNAIREQLTKGIVIRPDIQT